MSDEVSKVENPRKPGRPKGLPKTGGRRRGTPNRNSSTVKAALDQANVSLVELFLADVNSLEPRERIQELKWLFRYVYPQLKDIEKLPDEQPSQPASSPADVSRLLAIASSK